MIELYKKDLHQEELQKYFLENPDEGLKLGIRGMFEKEDGDYWSLNIVYIEDKKIIGYLSAESCCAQRRVEINRIFVLESYRNKGIAKKMFNYMELYYRRLEMTHIKVMYFGNNNVGEFYRKLGFKENFIAKYGTIRFGKWLENINLIKFLDKNIN